METYEEIQETLSEAGITLTFDTFEIFGISSSYTKLLRQEPSFSEADDLIFDFYVSTQDTVENQIYDGLCFTTTDNNYVYTFELNDNPVPYTDGWSRLKVTFSNAILL